MFIFLRIEGIFLKGLKEFFFFFKGLNSAPSVAPSIMDGYQKELEKNKRKEFALGRIQEKSFPRNP